MKKKIIYIMIFLMCIVGTWYTFYPLQEQFAEKEMYKYMQKQGIKKENIKSIKFAYGLLNGDCGIIVRLIDDPGFEYEYLYQPRGGLFTSKGCYFRLAVYDDETNSECCLGDVNMPKYLPLGEDLIDHRK